MGARNRSASLPTGLLAGPLESGVTLSVQRFRVVGDGL